MDAEIWRDVADYEGLYQVSNFGRVKSFARKTPRILKTVDNGHDYLIVTLCRDGKLKNAFVHRLVATAFISNPDGKSQVNHINGVKTDNCVENLEWVTHAENTRHAVATGLIKSGENSVLSKLTNEQVCFVRENPDGLTCTELARLFGVCHQLISRIQRGKVYENAGGVIRKSKYLPVSNDVREQIRAEYKLGICGHGYLTLAKKFGVHPSTIRSIIHEI